MRRYFKIITLFLAIITCFSCFLGCNFPKKLASDRELALVYLEQGANIDLPTNAKIVYFIFEEPEGFTTCYFQYVVFKLQSEPTDWLKENSFKKSSNQEKAEAFELSFLTMFDNWIPKEYIGKIPQEFSPSFEGFYYFFSTPYEKYFITNVYFMYLPESLTLITLMISP